MMKNHGIDIGYNGEPNEYYGWYRKLQDFIDLEYRTVVNEAWVGELVTPAIKFSEDGYCHGLMTRVKARTAELWTILEDAAANSSGVSAANLKKRKDMITLWKDDDKVLSLVVKAAMSPSLQDRIIHDKIRHSGKLILEELDKVFEPLGQKAKIRMTAELYSMQPTPGESIIDFLCRVRKLVDQLAAAGSPVSNDVLHEILPKRIQDQPGMNGLATRWIQHRDANRDISAYIDQCREELRSHPSQSFVKPQLYTNDTNRTRRGHFKSQPVSRDRGHVRSYGQRRAGKYHSIQKFRGKCFKCNRIGHKASECYSQRSEGTRQARLREAPKFREDKPDENTAVQSPGEVFMSISKQEMHALHRTELETEPNIENELCETQITAYVAATDMDENIIFEAILDTGASFHSVCDKRILYSLDPSKKTEFYSASGQSQTLGEGNIYLSDQTGREYCITAQRWQTPARTYFLYLP